MPIVDTTPTNYYDILLLKELLNKSTPKDGMAEKVEDFIKITTPLLNQIGNQAFSSYTLHGSIHSNKLLHIASYLIASETISQLNIVELALIIMSCYLHDIGMVCTKENCEAVLQSEEYINTIADWEELHIELKNYREAYVNAKTEAQKNYLEKKINDLHEIGLTSYLRPRHARRERYSEFITKIKQHSEHNNLFSINGVSFEDELISICESHNLESTCLNESIGIYEDAFPRDLPLGGYRVNIQFCAAILRISDILDFDSERTPSILFDCLRISFIELPSSEISLQEWNKHRSVSSIDIRNDEILIIVESKHPSIERSIREFCTLIETEIRATLFILSRNNSEITNKYRINLPGIVRPQIRSKGYIYKNLAFHLNESAIITLLLGENLYSSRLASIRELIQNSVDACLLRKNIKNDGEYFPQISVNLYSKRDAFSTKDEYWLEVIDNGIGMDDYILSNYFFKVGNSYYRSNDFFQETRLNKTQNFSPTSRFGIGILSVFMISDYLEVTTKRYLSPRGDDIGRSLFVHGKNGMAYVKENIYANYGTLIRVKLKDEFCVDEIAYFVDTYIKRNIIRTAIPLDLKLNQNNTIKIRNDNFYNIKSDFFQENRFLSRYFDNKKIKPKDIEPIRINLVDDSACIQGVIYLFYNKETEVFFKSNELPYLYFMMPVEFAGNRFTVNGFSMHSAKLSKALRIEINRLAVVIDIDVKAVPEVIFDVSRSSLNPSSISYIRKILLLSFRNSLNNVIFETDKIRKRFFENIVCDDVKVILEGDFDPIDDDEILSKVEAVVKSNNEQYWPHNFHKIIANKTNLSHTVALRAIKTLISYGSIENRFNNSFNENKRF